MSRRSLFDNLWASAKECRKQTPSYPAWVRYSRYATDTGVIADIQNALRHGAFATLRRSIDGSMNNEKLENAKTITRARTHKGAPQVILADVGRGQYWFSLNRYDIVTISERPITTRATLSPGFSVD